MKPLQKSICCVAFVGTRCGVRSKYASLSLLRRLATGAFSGASKLVLFILLFVSFNIYGYSSTNVPIEDPIYRDIDKLVAAGLVSDVLYGQRPWSRREIGRIITEARKNLGEKENPQIDLIIKRLESEFSDELTEPDKSGLTPLESARLDYALLNSPFRAVPYENGLANLEADINPLVDNQGGRHFVSGSNLSLETVHSAKATRFLSFYARPRAELLTSYSGDTELNPILQQGYGKFAYRKFETQVGRDSLIWGQGEHGGLLFSNNARPLDMVKITSSAPFVHPWIFKYLGPSKYTFFIGNLGPENHRPYAFIYGLRGSAKPFEFLEIGAQQTLIIGGQNRAPDNLQWYEPVTEFFFFRRGGLRGISDANLTDRRFGIDGRLQIPHSRGTTFYLEVITEDSGRQTVHVNFTQMAAYNAGIYIPLLTSDGRTDLRLDYSRMPPIMYRHSAWETGYTLNRHLIGDSSGPDADTLRMKLNYDLDASKILSFEAAYENRDNDEYTHTLSTKGGPDRVVQVINRTNEHRWRLESGVSWKLARRWPLQIGAGIGYEHVVNFGFLQESDLDNFIGRLTVAVEPPPLRRSP